jgi:AGCS family alanine or glycine:cation symporter
VVSGTTLTANAFASVIPHGDKFVVIAIMMFAFSTILGWSYYGERAVEYLFGIRGILPYKVIFVIVIFFGCTGSLALVWDIADTLNGFMSVPNLIAVTLLSGEVVEMTKAYLKKKQFS